MAANYSYCKETTAGHPVSLQFPECLSNINALVRTEGHIGEDIFEPEVLVMNLDVVEVFVSKAAGRERSKSMDSAFCITGDNGKQVVLVEYKFNHSDFRSLLKKDIEGKVAGSTENLGKSLPLHFRYFFVVQEGKLNEAYNRLFRMNPRPGNEYTPISLLGLKALFFQ